MSPPPDQVRIAHMVHHYFDINLDVLWITVLDDLPKLLVALRSADPYLG
jgi:uncharacterized protein with HEPN domain